MGTRTCARCGRPATGGQNLCSNCGEELAAPFPPAIPPPPSAIPNESLAGSVQSQPEGYRIWMQVVAVVLSVSIPIIGLVVALIMRGGQTNPVKRDSLNTWVVVSSVLFGIYMILWLLPGILSSFEHSAR